MEKPKPTDHDSNTVNSVSRSQGGLQPAPAEENLPCANTDAEDGSRSALGPCAHVVLYQPEIPQNTGNIGRTCVAVGAKLWIVRPAGFRLDNKRLSRAGLDYWQHLQLGDANNWDHAQEQLQQEQPGHQLFYLSRFAKREIWDAEFKFGDVFVFGSEGSGLPDQILQHDDPQALRLPTSAHVRSLNLATTAGIVLYEQQRQLRLGQ